MFQAREADGANLYDCSITGCDNTRHGYVRTEAESILGYVYLTPAADRLPVYRVANPNGGGGFRNADWVVPIYREANSAEYVTDTAARDALLAKGWRDDGIAFYTAEGRDPKTVYRIQYAPGADWQGDNVVFFFTDGPEHDTRAAQPAAEIADLGPRFSILDAQAPGSVALHRVMYPGSFDVLAAGEARFDQVLHQGRRPLWSLTWPGHQAAHALRHRGARRGLPLPERLHLVRAPRRRRRPDEHAALQRAVAHARRGAPLVRRGVHQRAARPDQPAQARSRAPTST